MDGLLRSYLSRYVDTSNSQPGTETPIADPAFNLLVNTIQASSDMQNRKIQIHPERVRRSLDSWRINTELQRRGLG